MDAHRNAVPILLSPCLLNLYGHLENVGVWPQASYLILGTLTSPFVKGDHSGASSFND